MIFRKRSLKGIFEQNMPEQFAKWVVDPAFLEPTCDNRFLAGESTSVKTWGNSLAAGISTGIYYRELSSET